MKDFSSLYSFGWKNFNDERDNGKEGDRMYTYTDKILGHFIRQSNQGGKVGAINQVFDSPHCSKFFQ